MTILLTIMVVGDAPAVATRRDVEVITVDTLAALRADDVRGSVVACVGGRESVSPDGLLDLAASLLAASHFDAARGGHARVDWSDTATYCPAHSAEDLLLELLLGSPFPAPLSSYVFTREAWLRMQVSDVAIDPDWPWAAREVLATFAMAGLRCMAVDRLAAQVGATQPVAAEDRARRGRQLFARLAARAMSTNVSDVHRRLLTQDWSLWRLSGATVVAGPQTRATGAVGTIVGHSLAGIRAADTIEGLCNGLRMRAPRLELTALRLRDALEGLATDGFIVREAERG